MEKDVGQWSEFQKMNCMDSFGILINVGFFIIVIIELLY